MFAFITPAHATPEKTIEDEDFGISTDIFFSCETYLKLLLLSYKTLKCSFVDH